MGNYVDASRKAILLVPLLKYIFLSFYFNFYYSFFTFSNKIEFDHYKLKPPWDQVMMLRIRMSAAYEVYVESREVPKLTLLEGNS